MNTTSQILGVLAYLAFLGAAYPIWSRYIRQRRLRSFVNRERIDALHKLANAREAVRMGWNAAPGTRGSNITGGWR